MANKNAKYRVQNGAGEFDVVHFETNMEQVQGLNAAMADKANQSTVDDSFRQIDEEVSKIEQTAQGLGTRVGNLESKTNQNEKAIQAETARATEAEGKLEERLAEAEAALRDAVGTGLEELKLQVETNKSGIAAETERATKAEQVITNSLATKLEQTAFSAEQGRVNNAIGEKASTVDLEAAKRKFKEDLALKAEATQVTQDIAASLVQANAYSDEKKVEADQAAQQLVDALEERVDGIDTRVLDNEGEISKLKAAVSDKNGNTQVYADMEEFNLASGSLQPKKGDLVYVIDIKKAYIYTGVNVIVLDDVQPPAGWVIFDEISTEVDLKDYIKSEEVSRQIKAVDSKLTKEVSRAKGEENRIDAKVDGVLGNISTERTEREEAIRGAEAKLEEAGDRLNAKIDAGLPTIGNSQPMGKEENHIWIEMEV